MESASPSVRDSAPPSTPANKAEPESKQIFRVNFQSLGNTEAREKAKY